MKNMEQHYRDMFEKYATVLCEWQLMRSSGDFIYVSDPNTYELLYVSSSGSGYLQPDWEDCHGRKCYELMQHRDTPCPFCTNPLLRYDRHHVWIIQNKQGHKFLLKDILIDWQGRPSRMSTVTDITDPARMQQVLMENVLGRNLLLDCTNLLMQSGSLRDVLNKVLLRICTFFDADRGCLQVGGDDAVCLKWYAPDVEDDIPLVPPGMLTGSWYSGGRMGRLAYLPDTQSSLLHPALKEIYLCAGIRSVAAVPLVNEKTLVGMLMLYNPRENISELSQIDLYSAWIANVVAGNRLKDSLLQMRYYDPLLGCYNLEGFRQKAVATLRAHPKSHFCLIELDIRYFKAINDRFGFQLGDELLRHFSRCVAQNCREIEVYGRIAADVLCILCHYRDPAEIEKRFLRFLKNMKRFDPLEQGGFELELAAGVYLIGEDDAGNIDAALDRMGTALKAAKREPGANLVFYSEEMNRRQLRAMNIGQIWKKAMKSGEIAIYLQPQYRYSSMELVGAEVLARWHNEDLGWIRPDEFIPILESKGCIYELDKYIWNQACGWLRRWCDEFGEQTPHISVNLSRLDVVQPNLCRTLLEIVQRHGLEPRQLRLEITESAYTDMQERLVATVHELKQAGFFLEMDDFGKGYSSLNVLCDVPVDLLKLDMNLLSSTSNTGRRGSILSSVVRMARWMNLPVIAEGVETRAQAEFLKNAGCDLMQGYYFARPLPAHSFSSLLRTSSLQDAAPRPVPVDIMAATEFLNLRSVSSLLFEYMGAAAIVEVCGDQTDALMLNDNFFALLGASRKIYEPYLRNMQALLTPQALLQFVQMMELAVQKRELMQEFYLQSLLPEIADRWLSITLRLISSVENRHILLMQLRDIDAEKKSRSEVQRHQELFRLLSESPGTISFEYDNLTDTITALVNRPDEGMRQYVSPHYLTHGLAHSTRVPKESREAVAQALSECTVAPKSGTFNCRLALLTDQPRYSRVRYTSLADETGQVYRVIGRVEDLEDELQRHRVRENELRLRSMQDIATGVWNRSAMEERVEHYLQNGMNGALLVFDIDDFKQVNDQYGHLVGDTVLKEFAGMLGRIFGNDAQVGRMGGDEFSVFLPGAVKPRQLTRLARMVLENVNTFVGNDTVSITVSIGITGVGARPVSFRALYQEADHAMYQAKRRGKATFVFYDTKDDAAKPARDKPEQPQ